MYQPVILRPIEQEEFGLLMQMAESVDVEQSRRARIILLSAEGQTASEISETLDIHPSNVKKWIERFNTEGLTGLATKKRGPQGGVRPRFSDEQFKDILELAERNPSDLGYDFKRWTPQKLANVAIEKGIVEGISHVTVRSILRKERAEVVDNPVRRNGTHSDESTGRSSTSLDTAMEAFLSSRYESAVEFFYAALNSSNVVAEDDALVIAYLSEALEELGRYDEAHEVIKKYEEPRMVQSLPPRVRARVRLRIGWICDWLQQYPKAIACLNESLKLFHDTGDLQGVAEANYALGHTYVKINEFGIAKDYLLDAAEAGRKVSSSKILARTYDRLGAIAYYEGALSDSKENYLKALEYAQGIYNTNLLGTVLLDLGTTCFGLGEVSKAHEYLRSAISSLEKGGRKDRLALAYNNLGEGLRREGEWNEALEMLNCSLEMAIESKKPLYEATARITLGEILCARGQYDEAEGHLKKSLELADADKWLESGALRALANVEFNKGRVEKAFKTLRQAMSLSTSIGDVQGLALAQVSLAELCFFEHKRDQAREYLEAVQGKLKDEEFLPISGFAQRVSGQLGIASGRLAEARQHIAQSLSIFTTVGYPFEIAKSHYEMGLLLKRIGDYAGADSSLRQAIEIFDNLGASTYSSRCRVALADEKYAPGNSGESVGSPSDVLLMQRLIEASSNRDLLLRELSVIIYENFSSKCVLVFQSDFEGGYQVLTSQGNLNEEVTLLLKNIQLSSEETLLTVSGGCVFRLGDETLGVYLYILTSVQIDIGRLQPFLKQAELCLENCNLRMAARRATSTALTHRVHTVMSGFIVGSPQMFDVIERIHKIRTSDVTVLITGESGTGKELVARAIHAESARARSVFLPFNCTATPKDIIDSQLFGHRRGAFTGATANYPGIIRAAEGGTLFLDEIGDLSLEVQPKLMRFLQEGEIQPLGETRPVKVDVRILAATNIDMEVAVGDGRFREDLFHRLNIIRIHIPPLRERREEIPVLANHFLDHFISRSGKESISFTEGALDALRAFDWPGNVRQLRNEIERAVAYASDSVSLTSDDFSPDIARPGLRRRSSGGLVKGYQSSDDRVLSDRNGISPAVKGNGSVRLKEAVAELEKRLIEEALERNKKNLTRTAQELGLSRRGLRLKLGQLGIYKERESMREP